MQPDPEMVEIQTTIEKKLPLEAQLRKLAEIRGSLVKREAKRNAVLAPLPIVVTPPVEEPHLEPTIWQGLKKLLIRKVW